MFAPAIRYLPALPLMFALAACGQSDVGAGGAGAEGSGGLTAQLKATCVRQVENTGDMSGIGEEICDCASRRVQDQMSFAELAAGENNAVLQDIIAQCADEALGIGASANTNEAET